MQNKKLQRALKYHQLTKELLDLKTSLKDELKVYLSYPQDQLFSAEYIYGILLGVIERLLPIGELASDNLLSLTEELKD